MGRVITPESAEGQELAKWNKPYVFSQFPMMVYRAQKRPDGVVSIGEVNDSLLGTSKAYPDGIPGAAERFTKSCQLIVNDERELARALEAGWRKTIDQALERFESKERTLGNEAAERNYRDRNMSAKAKAESAAAEKEASGEHLPEIPEKRRKPKASTRSAAA